MKDLFSRLSVEEMEELCLIPIWVSILIAGADNNIDKAEIRKAIRLAREKQNNAHDSIVEYYKKVCDRFEQNLKGYITLMPPKLEQRVEFLVGKLERVNYFFSKLDLEIAYPLYLSFREFAVGVARSSGGIFGLLAISDAESKYIDLKMIADPSESR